MSNTTTESTVGSRLAQARKEAGLTQRALGERVDCSLTTISDYETDRKIPSLPWLFNVARALGIAPCVLDRRLTDRLAD